MVLVMSMKYRHKLKNFPFFSDRKVYKHETGNIFLARFLNSYMSHGKKMATKMVPAMKKRDKPRNVSFLPDVFKNEK